MFIVKATGPYTRGTGGRRGGEGGGVNVAVFSFECSCW